MKHLEELIQIMIKLGIIENKDEFFARFTAHDPLEDAKDGVITIGVLYQVDKALRSIKDRVYADLEEIHLVARGYEEDTSDLD